MAISAAFGLASKGDGNNNNAQRSQSSNNDNSSLMGLRLQLGRVSQLVSAITTASSSDDQSSSDEAQQMSLDYKLQQQKPSELEHYSSSPTKRRQPNIGGIRRLMRRANTPEGLVLHYEARLRKFLGILPETNNGKDEVDEHDDDWQMIEQEEGLFTPLGNEALVDEEDMVVLSEELAKNKGPSFPNSPEITAGVKNSLVSEWNIQRSFNRLVVHNMCRYYGLVSFSNTLENGQRVLHICHPRFFKDTAEVHIPQDSFYDYLYKK